MANLTIPHKFAGLEPAVANEVNENFEAMKAYTIALQAELNTINESIAELDKKPVREVFAIYPSVSTKIPTGAYPLWTGETITNARTIYPDFWNQCLERKTLGTIKTVDTSAEYDEKVEEFGQCMSFYIDELNGHIRLPMIKGLISSSDLMAEENSNIGIGSVDLENPVELTLGEAIEVGGLIVANRSSTSRSTSVLYRNDVLMGGVYPNNFTYGESGGSVSCYAEEGDIITVSGMSFNSVILYPFKSDRGVSNVNMFMQVATNPSDISAMDTSVIANQLAEALEDMSEEYTRLVSLLETLVLDKENELRVVAAEGVDSFNANFVEKEAVVNAEVVKAQDAATEAQRIADDLGAIIVSKGRVDTIYDLPTTGNKNGDMYFVGLVSVAQKEEYVWDGSKWELFGVSSGSLSDYYTKEQTDALLEENFEKTVFSINEASKDASGNPNFMSVSGDQITFNGAVKYTQANGESKEYASVSPIALASGYVMLNNGVAEIVPELYIQQSEPVGSVWVQPVLSSNGDWGVDILSCGESSVNNARPAWKAFNNSNLDSNDCCHSQEENNPYIEFYINEISNISKFTFENRTGTDYQYIYSIENGELQYASDGVNFVKVMDITNSFLGAKERWDIVLPEGYGSGAYRIVKNGFAYLCVGRIEIEGYVMSNGTVWFNPYNNQAKQYNGTDWVDYNGVPVGTVTDGVDYNYQYNTQAGLNPSTASASPEEKQEIVSWGMPDYGAGVYMGTIKSFEAPYRCFVTVGWNSATASVFSVNNNPLGNPKSYQNVAVFLEKGDVLSVSTSLFEGGYYYPLKGDV